MNPVEILMIDDDSLFIHLTKKVILHTFPLAHISDASNGLKGLDYLWERHASTSALPDIILLDLSMPVMDGWDFLEDYAALLPKLAKQPQIYLLSSSISEHDKGKAKTIKTVREFITKPLKKEKILEILSPIVTA